MGVEVWGGGGTHLYAPAQGNSFLLASGSGAVSLHFWTGKSRITRFQALHIFADGAGGRGRPCRTAVGKKSEF